MNGFLTCDIDGPVLYMHKSSQPKLISLVPYRFHELESRLVATTN